MQRGVRRRNADPDVPLGVLDGQTDRSAEEKPVVVSRADVFVGLRDSLALVFDARRGSDAGRVDREKRPGAASRPLDLHRTDLRRDDVQGMGRIGRADPDVASVVHERTRGDPVGPVVVERLLPRARRQFAPRTARGERVPARPVVALEIRSRPPDGAGVARRRRRDADRAVDVEPFEGIGAVDADLAVIGDRDTAAAGDEVHRSTGAVVEDVHPARVRRVSLVEDGDPADRTVLVGEIEPLDRRRSGVRVLDPDARRPVDVVVDVQIGRRRRGSRPDVSARGKDVRRAEHRLGADRVGRRGEAGARRHLRPSVDGDGEPVLVLEIQ